MKALDAAIKTGLTTPAVTNLATGGIFRGRVPRGTAFPYLTYGQQPSDDTLVFGGIGVEMYPYLLHAVDDGLSATTAQDICAAAHAVLVAGLTVSGYTFLSALRRSTTEYTEDVEGVTYQHVVWAYDIHLDPS